MRRPLALLVASLLFAGCAVPPSGEPDAGGAEPAAGTVVPWGLEECAFVNWFVPVDADALRHHLPEGFEPAVSPLLPLDLGPANAYLGFEAFRCASGAGLEGDLAPLEYASVFTSALPPEELRVPDAGLHLFKWDTLVPDADRRELLLAAGVPARDGSADVLHVPGADGAARVAGGFVLDGLGAFAFDGGPATSSGAGGGEGRTFVEYAPAGEGLALWRATFHLDMFSLGQGAFRVPAGSWPAEVLGAETGPAEYFAGRWSFTDASVTLPAS